MQKVTENVEQKTLIGVLASHDSSEKTNELARLLEELYDENNGKDILDQFHFIFSGGTFQRIILGRDTGEVRPKGKTIMKVRDDVAEFIKCHATRLPDRKEGGITILANLFVQRQCSILWSLFSPITVHWLGPENLALLRLCDIWNVKRLMNPASVRAWFRHEAVRDIKRNRQNIPLEMIFGPEERRKKDENKTDKEIMEGKKRIKRAKGYYEITVPKGNERWHTPEWWQDPENQTIALIAHDEMKSRMVDFAIQYENELARFNRILATGATAQEVTNACSKLREKVTCCLPGPKGGDIEIATAVLFNRCHTVIFFIDPLNPHPHVEDIRTVFSACMAEIEHNDVRMLTNEVQAREWIEEAVRRN